ncbi:hypothetical protein [Streptomyces abyssalis]|nr:hypothetical protein [Streptomyces abyssalis]
MTVYSVLLYAVPALVIAVTLYTGYLGFKFYIAEVVRNPEE